MNHASASATSQHQSGRARVIGLFLARLLACLLRLRERGESTPPQHLAKMVSSADEMVHTYICNLAAVRLKTAGYTHAARALRARRVHRTAPIQAEHTSPEDLIARLEATIIKFNKADALSAHFARLVFCALCMIFTGEGRPHLPPSALRAPPPVNGWRKTAQAKGAAFTPQHEKNAGRGPP